MIYIKSIGFYTGVVAGVLCAMTALAEPKKSRESIESEKEQVVTLGVPKSEISIEPYKYVPARPVEYELSVSSWVPDDFRRGSYSGQESAFSKGNLPAISFNRLAELYTWSNGIVLSSKLGLSYFTMSRSATAQVSTVSVGSNTETVNFFSARVGVEAGWERVLPWGLEPIAGFAFLPSFINADTSGFEDGVSAFGVPMEATLGILWRTSLRASLNRGDFSVGVTGQAVTGSIGGSNMKGLGAQGVLRMSL